MAFIDLGHSSSSAETLLVIRKFKIIYLFITDNDISYQNSKWSCYIQNVI